MARRKKRGRPETYQYEDRQRLAELVRLHGARGARQAFGKSVSVETLLKIAREFGIQLKKGRRPRKVA